MLRKLIVLGITAGIAKKAWDAYQGKDKHATATLGSAGRTPTLYKPVTKTPTVDSRPDAT